MLDLFEVTRAAASSVAKLIVCQLRGVGAEGDSDGSEPTDDAPFLQQIGVTARPVARATLRALGYRHGDEVWLLKLFDKSKQPTGLEAGEIRFHGLEKVAAALRILATGKICIDAEANQDVVVNNGTHKVAREGDSVNGGTVAAVANTGTGVVTFTYTPYGGAPGAPSTTLTLSGGKITSGAEHFLA